MKKKILLFISVLLLLSACREPDSALQTIEAHDDFNHLLSQADETEGQFYFVPYMSMMKGDRMMYLDPAQMEAHPLCGKAECSHTDREKNCNARLPGVACGMAACGDQILYCVMSEGDSLSYDVYRMGTDGTKRRKVRTLTSTDPARDPDFPRNNTRLIFHRGHVYAAGQKAVLTDGEWSFCSIIIDYDLGNEEAGKILYEKPIDSAVFRGFTVRACGASLYYVNTDLTGEGEEGYQLEIGEISIESGQEREVYTAKTDFSVFEFQTDGNRFVMTSGGDGRVMEYSRESSELRELMDFSTEEEQFQLNHIAKNRVIGFSFPEEDRIHILIRDFEGKTVYDVKRERAEFEYGGRVLCGIDENFLYCDYVYGGDGEDAKECLAVYPLNGDPYEVVWQE